MEENGYLQGAFFIQVEILVYFGDGRYFLVASVEHCFLHSDLNNRLLTNLRNKKKFQKEFQIS